jgi:AcrR family transcriptional regulator
MNSLLELLMNDRLSNILVKDICRKAKVTRQTFYRHFKDKYDVVNWFYDKEIESLFIATYSISGIKTNLISKCNKYKQNLDLYRNIYQCDGQNSLAKHEFSRIYTSLSNKIFYNIGLPREGHSVELQYSLEFFCHGLIQSTIDWLNRSCPMSCDTFADIMIKAMPSEVKSKLKASD